MNKVFTSFFARLYGYLFIAMFAAIALTVVILDSWNNKSAVADFAEDVLFFKQVLEQQRQHAQQSVPDFYQATDSVLLSFDVSWLGERSLRLVCADWEFVERYQGVDVYSTDDGRLLSLHDFESSAGLLVIQNQSEASLQLKDVESGHAYDLEAYAALLLLVFIIVGNGIALYLPLRQLEKNINHMDEVSERIGKGDFCSRVQADLPAPLNKLGTSLNMMTMALSNKFNESHIFAQAVPHELRTPLSRIQLAAGILRQQNPREEQLALVENIEQYIEDIDDLCTQIIAFSKLNLNMEKPLSTSVSLSLFIRGRLQHLLIDPTINVRVICDSELRVDTNEVNLRLALDNLFKNALLHAKSQVVIHAALIDQQTVIRVQDDGNGIPDKDKETIFIPFARLDKSRNRKTGGLGLGLAITRVALTTMKGTIYVEDALPHGAVFVVNLGR